MSTFPQAELTSYPTYPIKEQIINSAISSPFENGMVQVRPRFTRDRRRWSINYKALTEAEKIIVKNFYLSVSGGSYYFTWVNPMDNSEHTVRFVSDLDIVQITGNYYTLSFDLEEL